MSRIDEVWIYRIIDMNFSSDSRALSLPVINNP